MPPKKKGSENPPIAPEPRLYIVGKPGENDEAVRPFSGHWSTANGVTTRLGAPTSRGHRFSGDCTAEGQRHGSGVERFPNGNRYTGMFEENKRVGLGTLRFKSGAVYEGDFIDGLPGGGVGTLTSPDGTVLDGEWERGRLEGQGSSRAPNGVVYTGGFRAGRRHGYGSVVYADGGSYTGAWDSGIRSGNGRLTTAAGAVYDGEWVNNRQHGLGTITYPSGVQWTGIWANGRKAQPVANGNVLPAVRAGMGRHTSAEAMKSGLLPKIRGG